jgi:redox-sensitive bicupin YhaK (pirin superfamily)
MGYSNLRVINEDRVVPGAGFGAHGHRDMEIITYVLDGALRHRDSTGGGATLPHGELQVMSAGRGIQHSEVNASHSEPVHLLQIWIEPNQRGVAPGYQQQKLPVEQLRAGWTRVVAGADGDAPFRMHADAALDIAWPAAGQTLGQDLDVSRRYFLHVARGSVSVAGQELEAGDAAMLSGEARLELSTRADSELLLFDLP